MKQKPTQREKLLTYLLSIVLYFCLCFFPGCFFSSYSAPFISDQVDYTGLFIGLVRSLLPYLLLSLAFVWLNQRISDCYIPAYVRTSVLIVAALFVFVTLWGNLFVIDYAHKEWAGLIIHNNSMDGIQPIMGSWIAGISSGVIVFMLGFFQLTQHEKPKRDF